MPDPFPKPMRIGSAECIAEGEAFESVTDWTTEQVNATIDADGNSLDFTLDLSFPPMATTQSFSAERTFNLATPRNVRWSLEGAYGFFDANSVFDVRFSIDDETRNTFIVNAKDLLPSLAIQGNGQFTLPAGEHTVSISGIRTGSVSLSGVTGSILLSFDPEFTYQESDWHEGFPNACYGPYSFPPLPSYLPDIAKRQDQIGLVRVLNLMYISMIDAEQAARDFLGDVTITSVPNDGSIIPGTIICTSPLGTVVFISGATTDWQRVLSATAALSGPFNQGAFGTSTFWFQNSTPILERVAAAMVPGRIVICGHSYGAALGSIATARIVPSQEVDLLTIGMPRPGDDRLAALLKTRRQLHLANMGDPVPCLPPAFLTLAYMDTILPPGLKGLWSHWTKPGNQRIIQADGVTFDSQADTFGLADLFAFVGQIVIGTEPAYVSEHSAQEYLNRLLL